MCAVKASGMFDRYLTTLNKKTLRKKKKSSDIYICIYTFTVLTALTKKSTKIIKNNSQNAELQGNMKHLHDFIIAKLAQCGFTSTGGTVHYSS